MKNLVAVGNFVAMLVALVPSGLAQQRDQKPLRQPPRILAQESMSKPGTIVVDVLNDNPAAIDAIRLDIRYTAPPDTRESRRDRGEDYYTSIGLPMRRGEGAIEPGETRRFIIDTGSRHIEGIRVAVLIALYRDGILSGDQQLLSSFTDRRASQARELSRLLALVQRAKAVSTVEARNILRSGLAERRSALPDRHLSQTFADELYANLDDAIKAADDDFAAALSRAEAEFMRLTENAIRVYSVR